MSRYDVEKFVPQPDQELICCICTNVLDEPMESPCRHVFCKICIETWLNNHETCPTCRFTVTSGDLKPVLPLVNNMLNKLTLICDFTDNGCKDFILLENYQRHIKACDYEKVVCKYPKCAELILRKLLKAHEDEECKHREIVCRKDCGLKISVSSVETHDCIKALKALCEKKDKETEILKRELLELKNMFVKLKEDVMKFRENEIRQRNNSWESSSTSSQDSDYSQIDWHSSRSQSRSRSRSPLPLNHVLSLSGSRSRSRTRSRSRSRSQSHTSTLQQSSYSSSPRSSYSSGSSVDSFPLRQRDRDEQEAILNSINLVSDSVSLIDTNLNRAHDLLITANNPVPIVRCVQCEELQTNCQCDHHSVHSDAGHSEMGAYSDGPSLTSFTEEGQFSSDNENLDVNSSDKDITVDELPQTRRKRRRRSYSEEPSDDSYSPTPVEGQTISASYNPTPLNLSPVNPTGQTQRSSVSSQSGNKLRQIPLVVDMNRRSTVSTSGPILVSSSSASSNDPNYSPESPTISLSSSSVSEHSRSRSPARKIGDYGDYTSESVSNISEDRSRRHSSHSPGPSYSPSPYRTCSNSSYSTSPNIPSPRWSRKRKQSKRSDTSQRSRSSSPNSSISGPCYRESERRNTVYRHHYDPSRAQKKQRVHDELDYSPSEWPPRHDSVRDYNPTSFSERSKSKYEFKINEGASTSSQQSDYTTNQYSHLNNYKESSNDDSDNERRMLKNSKRKGGGKIRKRSKRKSYSSEMNDFSCNDQKHDDKLATKPKLKSVVGLVSPTKPHIKIKFILRKPNGELMSSESSDDSN